MLLVSNDFDDTYYDDKMLYFLKLFEEKIEVETCLLKENEVKENIKKHFQKFVRIKPKFI